MPEFIPPYMGEEVKSNAERKVFDLLKGLDMNETVILHSLGLPRHNSKIFGEVDFVIVCKRGIACLEIKGGRVERLLFAHQWYHSFGADWHMPTAGS